LLARRAERALPVANVGTGKLDLNLSPPHFLGPISNDEKRELFAFDFETQEDDDSMAISSNQDFSDLDDCIDQSCRTETFSIANLIRGHQPKQQKTEDSTRQSLFVSTHHWARQSQ